MFSNFIKSIFFKPNHEPEYEEKVEHDIAMTIVDGKLVEVTSDDPEEGE